MKTNNCEEIMNSYLMLDKNEHVPLNICLHMLKCRKCRNQIRLLSLAEKYLAEPLNIQVPLTDTTIEKVLDDIPPKVYRKIISRPLSIAGWITGGIIMFLCFIIFMTFIPMMETRNLSLIYSLMIAVIVTAYCTLFVISNIDVFIKKISSKGCLKS